MGGVQAVVLQRQGAEGLEDVGEQGDVGPQVEVVVVLEGLALAGLPDREGALVVLRAGHLARQVAGEVLAGGEGCLLHTL